MHSYGIAHRDLKLENIIMLDDTDESQLKIVDFGLSKMIGPNETASDPFGTLVSQLLILTSLVVLCCS
jgi:serine/threonine protein kinase